jgi:hypothetical protein
MPIITFFMVLAMTPSSPTPDLSSLWSPVHYK